MTTIHEAHAPDPVNGAIATVPGPKVICLADVEPERIDWLWPGYLPLGKIVVIDGDPGVGKSTVCLDLAARVSNGSAMPGESAGTKGTVLVLSAEDGLADTIRPRLDAAGADPHRVITVTQIGEGNEARPVSIPGDLAALDEIIGSHDVKLVIVDVLMAYLAGEVNAHRDQDIRRVLLVLSGVAERRGCCIIVLRHLNKSGGANPVYRGGGSIGISGAARAVFMCGRDPEDETGEQRVFANVKMNIAAEPVSLAYMVAHDETSGVGRIEWLGSSEHRAVDLLGEPGSKEDHSERDEAADWIVSYLSSEGSEAPAKDVKKAARAAGFSERTLDRARQKAKVATGRSGFGKGALYVWRLDPPCTPHARHVRQSSDGGEHGVHGGVHGEHGEGTPAPEVTESSQHGDVLQPFRSHSAQSAQHSDGELNDEPTRDEDAPAVCTRCGRLPGSRHGRSLCDECDRAVDELVATLRPAPAHGVEEA